MSAERSEPGTTVQSGEGQHRLSSGHGTALPGSLHSASADDLDAQSEDAWRIRNDGVEDVQR